MTKSEPPSTSLLVRTLASFQRPMAPIRSNAVEAQERAAECGVAVAVGLAGGLDAHCR